MFLDAVERVVNLWPCFESFDGEPDRGTQQVLRCRPRRPVKEVKPVVKTVGSAAVVAPVAGRVGAASRCATSEPRWAGRGAVGGIGGAERSVEQSFTSTTESECDLGDSCGSDRGGQREVCMQGVERHQTQCAPPAIRYLYRQLQMWGVRGHKPRSGLGRVCGRCCPVRLGKRVVPPALMGRGHQSYVADCSSSDRAPMALLLLVLLVVSPGVARRGIDRR